MRTLVLVAAILSNCSCSLISFKSPQAAPKSIVSDALNDTVVLVEDHEGIEVTFCAGVVVRTVILTAHHCIRNHPVFKAAIKTNEIGNERESFEVDVMLEFPQQDLAVLRPTHFQLPEGRILSKEEVKFGDPVVVVGHPYGLDWSIITGIISHPARRGGPAGGEQKWIHISAPITNGNSGGPVFNQYGEVIGITSFSIAGDSHLAGAVHLSILRAALKAAYKEKTA